jgi:hypothetical protein
MHDPTLLRAVSTTLAPATASCAAMARPIPRDAPVMIAVRPVRSCEVMVWAFQRADSRNVGAEKD